MPVQMLLKKAVGLDIKMICPLHSLIIRKNIGLFVEKYDKWSSYTPEENSVLIGILLSLTFWIKQQKF